MVKINCTINISHLETYLTKWFWSWGPEEELETVAVGIFHKGEDGFLALCNWPWFAGDHSTGGSDFFNRCINLKINLPNTKTLKLLQAKVQTDPSELMIIYTHILGYNSKMIEACSEV